MTLDEIIRAIRQLQRDFLNILPFFQQFQGGLALDENNHVTANEIEALKQTGRELLRLFKEFSRLKGEAVALSKKNQLDAVMKEVDDLPASHQHLKELKVAFKDAFSCHHEVDNDCVQTCIDFMRQCQAMLDVLRQLFNQATEANKAAAQ